MLVFKQLCIWTVGGDRQLLNGTCALLTLIEPGIIEHREHPLCPLIVFGIGSIDLTVPIVAESQHLQLPSEVLHVASSGSDRVNAGFHGVSFGG